ncbi:putative phage abortive infection protein [Psychromonas sp. 14N.309.X.WAT.B.A12]|uniref:putative phage abortive infection protein n=1 Tax=Psychromonas sp. 14N.309.X.WAT.B.A12 TaxID=2998322 RepID=UPI0025B1A79D|nr:putative phage abortive infection protein [Psychromonas sp. 14N.309.X.WAT.B.A12]MDN2661830.1 putative phage abortive infection protein [Psychromonas sp. 14N.309.X.WAT.B.A12]
MQYLIIFIVLFALSSAAASIYFYHDKFGVGYFSTAGDWGAFGDFFGGVLNPTFTLLSIILLAHTLFQNKKALNQANESIKLGQKSLDQSAKSLQQNQKALEINTQELSVSSKALESSSEALHSQTIGNVFFNLLEQHNNIVNNIHYNNTSGRSAFTKIVERIQAVSPLDTYNKYHELQMTKNHIFGHYFRNLYQIIKYIDEYSDLETEVEINSETKLAQKKNFMRILRAQLSSDELVLLFMNCLPSMVDGGQFKDLLIKYEMLKHLRISKFEANEIVLTTRTRVSVKYFEYYYDQVNGSAFGNNETALNIKEAIKKHKSL